MTDLQKTFRIAGITGAACLVLGFVAGWWFTGGGPEPAETNNVTLPTSVHVHAGKPVTIAASGRGVPTFFTPPYEHVQYQGSGSFLTVIPKLPGNYYIGANTVGSKGATIPVYTLIIASGETPEPPEPPPEPPVPGSDKFWIIVVHDTSRDTPEFAEQIDSPRFRKTLADKGHKFRKYSSKKADLALPGWKAELQKAGSLPAVIFLDQATGKSRGAIPWPGEGILDAIRKAGGA